MRVTLWWILFGIAINRFCSLLPSGIYFDPFPFYDLVLNGQNVGINAQSYAYFLLNHIGIIAIWFGLSLSVDSIFFKFMWIEILSLGDFLLRYEQAWFHIGSYGVEFTDAKILMYAYFILRWNGR